MTLGRREKILAGLLGAVLVIALLSLWGGDGGEGAPAGETLAERSGRLRRAAAETPLVADVVALDMAALEAESGEFEVGRNPFRYAPAPAPPPAPAPVRPEPRPTPPPTPAPTPPPVTRPAGCQVPSTSGLQYLGLFGPRGAEIAVVVNGDEIHNVREGEMIGEDFRVVEIGYESLALGSVACPEEPAVRLPVGGS